MQDPLLQLRKTLALHSLQQSHLRIKSQKQKIAKYDQTQLDEQLDELVYGSLGFENVCTQYGDSSSVTRGKFSRCGRYYVTVGASGEGKVWGVGDGDASEFGILVTEIKAADKLCDVDIHPNIGVIPAFGPNIITGSTTGQLYISTFNSTLPVQKSIKIQAHSDRINSIRFHPSATMFLTGSYDKSWSIWDANRVKELSNQKGHAREIHTLSLHPDGSLIVTGDLGGDGMVWDLRTGKGIYQFCSNNSIVCSSFHPNGYQFAIAGKNNMISIFDIRRKKEIKIIPAHLKLVSDLCYTENGAILFSAGHDNMVKLWHGRTYCSVGSELEHLTKISSIAYCGGKLGVTMLDRKWTIWSNNRKIGAHRGLGASQMDQDRDANEVKVQGEADQQNL